MSGGHFHYKQFQLADLAGEIDKIIDNKSNNFRPETLNKFRETRDLLLRAEKMVHRIDWLVSGDDGEESFHRRWVKEGLE